MLNRDETTIRIMLKDLLPVIDELMEEAESFPNEPLGVEISIGIFKDYETRKDVKKAHVALLHLPSRAHISLNNDLKEITKKNLEYIWETGNEPNT